MYPNLWRHNGRIVGFRHFGHNALHNGRSGLYGGNGSPGEDTPSFDLPLANMSSGVFTIAPRTALGSSTPTYTRATAATTIDFEGLLKTCLSGEVRCLGGRRVRNFVPCDATFSGWTEANCTKTTGVSDPDGGTTAITITATSASGDLKRNSGLSVGMVGLPTVWLRRRTGTGNVSLYKSDDSTQVVLPITTEWKRYSAGTATVAGSNFLEVILTTSGDAVDVWHPQVENVTGQTNQNPSEFVSNGVLSSPTYHGVGVDGVKVFTTLNGNTVASNVVTEATGASITSAQGACAGGVTAGVVDAIGPVGYLPEGARTNLCLQSNTFSNATWLENADPITVTQNLVGPDGATSGWTFEDDGGTNEAKYQSVTVVSATTYTWSVFIYKGLGNPRIWVNDNGNYGYVDIDTTTGGLTISGTTTAWGTPVMQNFNSLWWRLSVPFTTTGVLASIGLYAKFGGTGTAGYAFAVLEAGAFASTYIPTTTVAVARNADVLTYVAAGNINLAVGSAYAEYKAVVQAFNCIGNGLYSNGGSQAWAYDGTNIAGVVGAWVADTQYKIASSWGGAAMSVCSNGGAVATTAFSGAISVASPIPIGSGYGSIRNVRIYPRALSSAQLQAMTA